MFAEFLRRNQVHLNGSVSGESDGGKETSPRKGRREGTRGREGGVGEEKGGGGV